MITNNSIRFFINKNFTKTDYGDFVLGVDIGGTNTNIAVAGLEKNTPFLLFSHHFKTEEIDSIIPAIQHVLRYTKENYDIEINNCCIGAAGVVSSLNDYAELTNVSWNVDANEIIKNTALNNIKIINDFQIIGFGINYLNLNNNNDIYIVRKQKNENLNQKFTKAIVGAGTGLGKSILVYNELFNTYIPLHSEGGHADFSIQNKLEFELVDFTKKLRKIKQPLTYEELISGRGLESIYLFLRQKNINKSSYTEEIDKSDDKPQLISKYKSLDKTCKETFKLFTLFYARCLKNFALETMAVGGIYIAGGIALKNKEIFNTPAFISEFENTYRRNDLLKKIPIYVIMNYDVSLYGACYAAIYYNQLLKDRMK